MLLLLKYFSLVLHHHHHHSFSHKETFTCRDNSIHMCELVIRSRVLLIITQNKHKPKNIDKSICCRVRLNAAKQCVCLLLATLQITRSKYNETAVDGVYKTLFLTCEVIRACAYFCVRVALSVLNLSATACISLLSAHSIAISRLYTTVRYSSHSNT